MEGYGYQYPGYQARGDADYPDHGDGFGEYYGMTNLADDVSKRPTCSKYRKSRGKRSQSNDNSTKTKSRSSSKTRSRRSSKSHSRSRSRSRSRSMSRSRTTSRPRELNWKQPSLLDSFRVLYLTSSRKKTTSKFLSTTKRQDRVQELLKSDGLGSKKWLFYPRTNISRSEAPDGGQVSSPRDNSDQRVKVDGVFFRKYKRSKKIDTSAPIAKLKRWELAFYEKMGFIQAV